MINYYEALPANLKTKTLFDKNTQMKFPIYGNKIDDTFAEHLTQALQNLLEINNKLSSDRTDEEKTKINTIRTTYKLQRENINYDFNKYLINEIIKRRSSYISALIVVKCSMVVVVIFTIAAIGMHFHN